jgi:hypothetical protein
MTQMYSTLTTTCQRRLLTDTIIPSSPSVLAPEVALVRSNNNYTQILSPFIIMNSSSSSGAGCSSSVVVVVEEQEPIECLVEIIGLRTNR